MASKFETLASKVLLKGMTRLGMFDTGHASDLKNISVTRILVTDEQGSVKQAKYVSRDTQQEVMEPYEESAHGKLDDWFDVNADMTSVVPHWDIGNSKIRHSHSPTAARHNGIGYEIKSK